MKRVGGLISVSENYIQDLKNRYPEIKSIPDATITFGAFTPDMEIAAGNKNAFTSLLNPAFKNIVYIGRGGMDMHKAIIPLFKALKKGLEDQPELFSNIKLNFIGTSYAAAGKGTPTILPLAKEYGVDDYIIEFTDRISYYHALLTLQQADALFIPGSDDPKYSASKIYPYLLLKKPVLAIFNPSSPAIDVLNEYGVEHSYSYESPNLTSKILKFFTDGFTEKNEVIYNAEAYKKYSAQNMTQRQCKLFETVIYE